MTEKQAFYYSKGMEYQLNNKTKLGTIVFGILEGLNEIIPTEQGFFNRGVNDLKTFQTQIKTNNPMLDNNMQIQINNANFLLEKKGIKEFKLLLVENKAKAFFTFKF